jgi:hypothetical protein
VPSTQPAPPPFSLLSQSPWINFNNFTFSTPGYVRSIPLELVGQELAYFGELLATAFGDQVGDDLAVKAGGRQCTGAARAGGEAGG